ncbi:MAG TPA: hypothetical protein VD810_03485, partial [Methylophilaceae bacterium]|nr:hypothetical protein [Methylophilaceae bacterium]
MTEMVSRIMGREHLSLLIKSEMLTGRLLQGILLLTQQFTNGQFDPYNAAMRMYHIVFIAALSASLPAVAAETITLNNTAQAEDKTAGWSTWAHEVLMNALS